MLKPTPPFQSSSTTTSKARGRRLQTIPTPSAMMAQAYSAPLTSSYSSSKNQHLNATLNNTFGGPTSPFGATKVFSQQKTTTTTTTKNKIPDALSYSLSATSSPGSATLEHQTGGNKHSSFSKKQERQGLFAFQLPDELPEYGDDVFGFSDEFGSSSLLSTPSPVSVAIPPPLTNISSNKSNKEFMSCGGFVRLSKQNLDQNQNENNENENNDINNNDTDLSINENNNTCEEEEQDDSEDKNMLYRRKNSSRKDSLHVEAHTLKQTPLSAAPLLEEVAVVEEVEVLEEPEEKTVEKKSTISSGKSSQNTSRSITPPRRVYTLSAAMAPAPHHHHDHHHHHHHEVTISSDDQSSSTFSSSSSHHHHHFRPRSQSATIPFTSLSAAAVLNTAASVAAAAAAASSNKNENNENKQKQDQEEHSLRSSSGSSLVSGHFSKSMVIMSSAASASLSAEGPLWPEFTPKLQAATEEQTDQSAYDDLFTSPSVVLTQKLAEKRKEQHKLEKEEKRKRKQKEKEQQQYLHPNERKKQVRRDSEYGFFKVVEEDDETDDDESEDDDENNKSSSTAIPSASTTSPLLSAKKEQNKTSKLFGKSPFREVLETLDENTGDFKESSLVVDKNDKNKTFLSGGGESGGEDSEKKREKKQHSDLPEEMEEMMETIEVAPKRSKTHRNVPTTSSTGGKPVYYFQQKQILDSKAGTLEAGAPTVVSAAVRANQSPFHPWCSYHQEFIHSYNSEYEVEIERILDEAVTAPMDAASSIAATPLGFNSAWRTTGVVLHPSKQILVLDPAIRIPPSVLARGDAAIKKEAFKAVVIRGVPKFEKGIQTTLTNYHETSMWFTVCRNTILQQEQVARMGMATERNFWIMHIAGLEYYYRNWTIWNIDVVLKKFPANPLSLYYGAVREIKGENHMLKNMLELPAATTKSTRRRSSAASGCGSTAGSSPSGSPLLGEAATTLHLKDILEEDQIQQFDAAISLSEKLIENYTSFTIPFSQLVKQEEQVRDQQNKCYEAWCGSMDHYLILIRMAFVRRSSTKVKHRLRTTTDLDSIINEVEVAIHAKEGGGINNSSSNDFSRAGSFRKQQSQHRSSSSFSLKRNASMRKKKKEKTVIEQKQEEQQHDDEDVEEK